MNEKSIPGLRESAQEVLSSLTPREADVLRKRFGIDLEENNQDESNQVKQFIPPSGSNSGQSGAPQIAIAPAPSLQDKDHSSHGDKRPNLESIEVILKRKLTRVSN